MAELTELSGTRSEGFFGPVERCQAEYVARKKLKRTASVGFQRSGRHAAFAITLPVILKVSERSVIGQQAIAAPIDFGGNFSALPINCRERSKGFNQRSRIATLKAQANGQLGWQQQIFSPVWRGCGFLGHAAGTVSYTH